MFTRTRLQLTIIYTLIFVSISGAVSTVFYFRTASVLDQQFEVIEERLQKERLGLIPRGNQNNMLKILPEDIQEAKDRIVVQLVTINGVVALLFAVAGYYLSGKTLEPLHFAMEEQKRFIGDAAHELKTPLTALKTSMEVNLMDENITKEAASIFNENLEDVDRLHGLVESLLVLNQQEHNGIKKETVNLAEIIESIIEQLQSIAQKKNIEVSNTVPKEITIYADKIGLQRLFTVLVDNAIKYSESGDKVSIVVDESKKDVIITVSDTGSGIAKHHLPHIFDRFYRVDSSREKGGYGLGLSVAKSLVSQHGGSISVDSTQGKGTTFTVTLSK